MRGLWTVGLLFALGTLAWVGSTGNRTLDGTRVLGPEETAGIRGRDAGWPCQSFMTQGTCPAGMTDHMNCVIQDPDQGCDQQTLQCPICSGMTYNQDCLGAAEGRYGCTRVGLLGGCGVQFALGTRVCELGLGACRCSGVKTSQWCFLFTVTLNDPGCAAG
jgi:hypothetical protein